MGSILPVYALVMGILLAVVLLVILRSDESLSRKWSRIRVRVDERSRHHMPERPEEEYEIGSALDWFILGTVLVLIFLLMRAA